MGKKAKAEGESTILKKLLKLKFGALPDWADVKLSSLSIEQLELVGERVLFTNNLEDIFQGL